MFLVAASLSPPRDDSDVTSSSSEDDSIAQIKKVIFVAKVPPLPKIRSLHFQIMDKHLG